MSAEVSLTKRTGRALQWNYVGLVVKTFLTLGINTLLTRILGPKPFGELAVASIVFGFGQMLSNVGLTSAIVRKPDLDDEDIRFCFTVQMIIGLGMGLLLFGSAGLWAKFFHDPSLVLLLRVFSSLFVLQGFGNTAAALLNRAQDARTTQWITIVSYVVSYVMVCVPMALRGSGIWSLVTAWLLQSALSSVLSYAMTRHAIRLRWHADHTPMLRFGLTILGANICSWAIFNLDNTTVGRVRGPIALGFYSRAFALAMSADGVTWGIVQVLLPAFSRVQNEIEKLRGVYASVLGLILLVFLPLFGTVAAVSDVVVLGLYGPKWAAVIPVLRPIALAVCFHAALSIAGSLLSARGVPHLELRAQAIAAAIGAVAYVVAVRWSLVALGWTVFAVYMLRFALLTNAVNQAIGTGWRDFVRTCWPGFILCAVSATAGRILARMLPVMPMPLRLTYVITGTIVADAAFLLVSVRWLLRPIFKSSPQLTTLIPVRYRAWIIPAEEALPA